MMLILLCCSTLEDTDAIDIDFPLTDETFHLIAKGSKRGGDILVSTYGYSYGVSRRATGKIHWRCNVRPKGKICNAGVTQEGETFIPKSISHNHPSEPGLLLDLKVRKKVGYT